MFRPIFKKKPKTKIPDEVLADEVRKAALSYNNAVSMAKEAGLSIVAWTYLPYEPHKRRNLIMDYLIGFLSIKRHDVKDL